MLSADEDAFHATIKTLKIFEHSDYFRSKVNLSSTSKSEDIACKSEYPDSSLTEEFPSDFMNSHVLDSENIFDNCQLNYKEFQTFRAEIAVISEMYKHYFKKVKEFQDQEDISYIQDYCADVMHASNLSEKIDQMISAVNHIKIIAAEVTKLKHVLRNSVLNDVWKINKDYHRTVVNFFNLASEIVKDAEVFVHFLESKVRYYPENSIALKNKEMKILAMLHKNVDILSDFRNYVQKYCKDSVNLNVQQD